MKKETINKAILKGGRDVEIFCNKQYKGYYVRGVISLVSHNDPYERDCVAICRYARLALVNDRYQERIKKQMKEFSPPPPLFGNTKEDYLEVLNTYKKERDGLENSLIEQMFKIKLPRTLMISLDEAEITQSQYLDDSIKKAKDIILLHADFVLSEAKTLLRGSRMIDCVERIYAIPVFYFQEREGLQWSSRDWFEQEYDSFHMDFDCDYPTKRDYCRILKSISNVSNEWIKQRKITRDYVRKLNRLNKCMGDRTYPLMSSCGQFLDDLVDELTTNKQIGKCLHCGDFFVWPGGVPEKKFCSLKSEGKDCGKKARYRRWYEKHKSENRAKSRNEMRETRAWHKERGYEK